ncbi:hypothetical protein HAX54_019826 [Datura stramonium]|uniref:Uncharacterized protein n=1 Tax=Datura stramonium TaxID=4076 RepID=A0ABS8USC2_DATST|nr:hypothetical protein [Datura stramonium]
MLREGGYYNAHFRASGMVLMHIMLGCHGPNHVHVPARMPRSTSEARVPNVVCATRVTSVPWVDRASRVACVPLAANRTTHVLCLVPRACLWPAMGC